LPENHENVDEIKIKFAEKLVANKWWLYYLEWTCRSLIDSGLLINVATLNLMRVLSFSIDLAITADDNRPNRLRAFS
jgi:hypothetical protein